LFKLAHVIGLLCGSLLASGFFWQLAVLSEPLAQAQWIWLLASGFWLLGAALAAGRWPRPPQAKARKQENPDLAALFAKTAAVPTPCLWIPMDSPSGADASDG
jgi:hypothetical protein